MFYAIGPNSHGGFAKKLIAYQLVITRCNDRPVDRQFNAASVTLLLQNTAPSSIQPCASIFALVAALTT